MLIRDLFEQLSHTGSACARRLLCCLLIGAFVQTPKLRGDDPWPFWGRTPTRLGRTDTVGPRTARIAWSVEIGKDTPEGKIEASPVMDAEGRIFVGHARGMTAVDSHTHEVLWEFADGDVNRGAALWNGRVMWADFSPFRFLYCFDAATGEEIWRFKAAGGMFASPVVDSNGVVYFVAQQPVVYARRVEDGSEVWTTGLSNSIYSSPSLEPGKVLVSSEGSDVVGIHPVTGARKWTFRTSRVLRGAAPILDGRAYIGSNDKTVYCVDLETGQEIWSFPTAQSVRGALAIGHEATIYAGTLGDPRVEGLHAISPDGKQLWRYLTGEAVFNAPIVDGTETIYVTIHQASPPAGWVHAVRPNGTARWVKRMPQVTASPMLAPDGTLYVVASDKILYAFRDQRGDLNCDGSVDLTDVEPFIMALLDPEQYQRWNPDCNAQLADMTEDGSIDLTDVESFIECILGERCP